YEHENGFPFVVLPDVPETRFIYLAGQSYERTESALMRSWLSAGDVAIDCGANVGLMTALMATGVGGAGRVVSVEASPDTCRRLESVMSVLGLTQVKVLNRCVCDKDGEIAFQNDATCSEARAMHPSFDLDHAASVKVRSI